MNIQKHNGTRHTNFYLFIYLLIYSLFNDAFCSSEYNPSSKLIPDNYLDKAQKEAVVTSFVVLSQNFAAMSEVNNENPNSKSRSYYLPNTKH